MKLLAQAAQKHIPCHTVQYVHNDLFLLCDPDTEDLLTPKSGKFLLTSIGLMFINSKCKSQLTNISHKEHFFFPPVRYQNTEKNWRFYSMVRNLQVSCFILSPRVRPMWCVMERKWSWQRRLHVGKVHLLTQLSSWQSPDKRHWLHSYYMDLKPIYCSKTPQSRWTRGKQAQY